LAGLERINEEIGGLLYQPDLKLLDFRTRIGRIGKDY
jgi:hypothetical protein